MDLRNLRPLHKRGFPVIVVFKKFRNFSRQKFNYSFGGLELDELPLLKLFRHFDPTAYTTFIRS